MAFPCVASISPAETTAVGVLAFRFRDKLALVSSTNANQSGVRREKTAISRFRCSKPVMLAFAHEIISPERSVLDYGCGKGEDLRYLRGNGIDATGWDPYYQPKSSVVTADVVNLGYVLNVIEDPQERDETLRKAFELARQVLVVAVRVERGLPDGLEFSDGVLTTRGSFQKIYEQREFSAYLEAVLGRRPHMAALGIAYVFKDERLESSYLASLAHTRVVTSRTYAIEQFAADATAKEFVELAVRLGRPPVGREFQAYQELQRRFGSRERIEKLTLRLLSPDAVQEVRRCRRDDILTFIAMTRLQNLRPLRFRLLPDELRADIKMLWPSYVAALKEGETFLFQMGKPEAVSSACQQAPLGKKLPDALYIHRSGEEQLGALLRLLIFAGRQIVGEVDYNIVKISSDGRKLSFLKYDRFEEDAHPVLSYSVRAYLPRAEYTIRDYSESPNPPILHRKEMLVDPLHEKYATFAELTKHEEQLGLLSRNDIGMKQGWLAALAEKGVTITDHTLCQASTFAIDE